MSIEQLLIQCKRKDPKAQEALYKSYAKRMFVHCYRYLKSKEDAEDILAEGFAKAFHHMPKLEYLGEAAFEAWLKRIIINEALGTLRKKKQMQFSDYGEIDEITTDPTPLSQLAAQDIYLMITHLPTGLRTIFNLYAIEGYSHSEIAEMLNITESTSRTQLMKARRALQAQLNASSQSYGS